MTASDLASPPGLDDLEWLGVSAHALDWNGPADRPFTPFAGEALDRPILDHLQRVVSRQPDRIALTDGHTQLTYAQLWDGLSGLAEALAARTPPGDLIGILLPATPMFPMAILACLAAGRPFVALDPHYPADWLDQVLADAKPALVIGRDIELPQSPPPAPPGWRPADLAPDAPACVLFTSGSTGRPKGIVNSQKNLLQRVAQAINAAHINSDDRFLTLASLCTIVGVRDAITALVAGATLRLIDPQRVGAREIVEVVRAEAITILFAFPALLRSVLAGAEPAEPALRLVRIGGDTTLWSDIDRVRAWLPASAHIQLIYAATEAPMMQWFVDGARRGDDARIPIGYPLPGNRLAIADDDGRSTEPGEIGELIVASPFVTVGRWADGRFSAEDVEPAPGGGRIFRTGDLVRQRPDGLLERIGRRDRQVKVRGTRVELEGVEALLRQHPHVSDVAVLAQSADTGASLVAYVSATDGAPGGLVEKLKVMMRSAPAAMRPGRIQLVDAIPRLPSSKLDVQALSALDEDQTPGPGVAAADAISRTVAQAWQAVLHAAPAGPDADFFEAGGDSLKAVELTLELERALGAELSVGLINEAPRFADLIAALRGGRTPRYVPLVTLKPGEGAPAVFFIHGVGGAVVEILPTARKMAWPGAVIGIQARGLAGEGPPHTSVAAMAQDYLREVKARQPRGPYHLCGYSFGGLVAFEMACRLAEAGDEVGLVGLFDTMMSPVRWPLRAWLSILGGRIARRLRGERTPRRDLLDGAPPLVLKVAGHALLASARYRPAIYSGQLTLFSPADREPGLPSLESIWRRHAGSVVVVQTPGRHATMLSVPNAEAAAAALTGRLNGIE